MQQTQDEEDKLFQQEMTGEEAPAETPAADAPVEAPVEAPVDAEAEEAPVQEAPAFDAMEEIRRLRSALEKTNGTYGSQLASLRKQIETLTAPKEVPVPTPAKVEVTADRLAKLKSEFPELAELLAQDLSELLAKPTNDGLDKSAIAAEIEQRLREERDALSQREMQREARLLAREHPDWRDIAAYSVDDKGLVKWGNPAFGQWVVSQPEEVQEQVLNSSDALELSDILSTFKNATKQTRQAVLNKAVQPKGTLGSAKPSLQDEEERLYREELEKDDY